MRVERHRRDLRHQLLCEAIADHEQRDFAEQLVIFPDDAGATAALVTEYAKLLQCRDAVVARTLSEVVATLQQAVRPPSDPNPHTLRR